MKKEEFYFDSRDGKSKLHAVRYTPDDGKVRGVLQIVHGMAEHVERYEEFAEFLTGKGLVVTAEDHLGHGGSIGENGTVGYFCSQDPATVVVRDVHRLKKITQGLYPGVPYVLMGHSMGSFIARNYICRYGTGITAAIIMGTGMQPAGLIKVSKIMAGIQKVFCGPKHSAKMLDKIAFGAYNNKINNPRTTFDWLTKEDSIVDKYIEDPLCGFTFTVNGFATLFELIDRLHKPENLSRVPHDLPIFMVSGEADPVGDYGKGVQLAYDSLKNAGVQNITMKLYEGDRHEILNEKDRAEVMDDIWDWIEIAALQG
ncbi:MAG: alpha/beta hydrolase [Acetatifactor sp.]|nr:alpha/beta hydrolase [Acetatifactor sp.]